MPSLSTHATPPSINAVVVADVVTLVVTVEVTLDVTVDVAVVVADEVAEVVADEVTVVVGLVVGVVNWQPENEPSSYDRIALFICATDVLQSSSSIMKPSAVQPSFVSLEVPV